MNLEIIGACLQIANNHLRAQTQPQVNRIFIQDNNSILYSSAGAFTEYVIQTLEIASDIKLFDTHSLRNEINNEYKTIEEKKANTILIYLVDMAKENLKLYDKVANIIYSDGAVKDFHECIPIKREVTRHLYRQGSPFYFLPDRTFDTIDVKHKEYFDLDHLRIYFQEFIRIAEPLVRDEILKREGERKMRELQITELKQKINIIKDPRFWVGVGLGLIPTIWQMVQFILQHKKG